MLLIIVALLLGICYKIEKDAICGSNICPSGLYICLMNCFTGLVEIGYCTLLCYCNMNVVTLFNKFSM